MSTLETSAKTPRKRYTTDLSDDQWARVAPLLAEYHPATHRKRVHALREILNAIFYRLRTGCQWRNLPGDFPPYSTVSDYYHTWRRRGVFTRLHDTLRTQVRLQAGKAPQPSAGSLDSQTAKSTEKGGPSARWG